MLTMIAIQAHAHIHIHTYSDSASQTAPSGVAKLQPGDHKIERGGERLKESREVIGKLE